MGKKTGLIISIIALIVIAAVAVFLIRSCGKTDDVQETEPVAESTPEPQPEPQVKKEVKNVKKISIFDAIPEKK